MNHKPLFLAVTFIALLVIGGVFWVMQKRQVVTHQPVAVEPVGETPVQTEREKYPQHIEAIPGNTDEVWYNIPELGIRMKLNKEFAEDLIYRFVHEKNMHNEEWDAVYFSSKKITEMSSCLLPPVDSPLGVITAGNSIVGGMNEVVGTNNIVNIEKKEYLWTAPQEGCWNIDGKGSPTFPIKYNGSGFKTISDAMKTLEALK